MYKAPLTQIDAFSSYLHLGASNPYILQSYARVPKQSITMKSSIILPFVTLLSLATASQSSVDDYPSNISPCVVRDFIPSAGFTKPVLSVNQTMLSLSRFQIRCLSEGAVVAGCLSYIDTKCTCVSPAFKDAVMTCLTDACTKDDLAGMI